VTKQQTHSDETTALSNAALSQLQSNKTTATSSTAVTQRKRWNAQSEKRS